MIEQTNTTEIPIIPVDYGIASNYGDFIEINRKLDYYPKLKNKIINHELRHCKGKYNKKDFLNDFQSKDSTFFETLDFCKTNKEAIINYFPFMYSYHAKEWTFNTSAIFPFTILGVIFMTFFRLAFGLPFLNLIIGWLSAVLILNGLFLFQTHVYVKTTLFTRNNKKKKKKKK